MNWNSYFELYVSGNTGAGVNGVKKTVEQAVGSDILFGGVS